MIISKVNIIAFGGIRNRVIEFGDGMNLVYGLNEAGKSTIQAFIKAFLYGFSNSRSKDKKSNDRAKYYPITGEKIRGELYIKHEDREYIIQREFGKQKKDDDSKVLDGLTGEEISYISKDEPGKYFFEVNLSTFSKTVFIKQLGVAVEKDKEEEIMERAVNLLGGGEENISIQKVIDKLEGRKKILVTPRKNGELDLLNEKLANCYEEKHIAYKISENNLENEGNLIEAKEKRKFLQSEIKNLEIYKKYIKKIKLQKEYEEISNYLKKSEELKKEVSEIDNDIDSGKGIIDLNYINDIKEENSLYLSLLDLKMEESEKIKIVSEKLKNEKEKFPDFEEIELLDDNVKEILLRKRIEQENILEKIELYNKENKEVDKLKDRLLLKKRSIGELIVLDNYRDEITDNLNKYESTLRLLKEKLEDGKGKEKKNTKDLDKKLFIINGVMILAILLMILSFSIFSGNLIIPFICLPVVLYLINLNIKLSVEKKDITRYKNQDKSIYMLKEEINNIEKKLMEFINILKAKDYEEFLRKIKIYDDYKKYENEQMMLINQKEFQRDIYDLVQLKNQYSKNKDEINNLLNSTKCDDIDDLLYKISIFDKVNKELLELKIEIERGNESIDRFEKELIVREERICEKLKAIGWGDLQLQDLDERLNKIKEDLEKREDLKKTLNGIEETYKVLIKDKDIEKIKDELQDILKENINYSYESEEEIDLQIRRSSEALINIEKEIKDIEHLISKSFIGKRRITEVEEDIAKIIEEQDIKEKELTATEIAMQVLNESVREIRSNFGPRLNEEVLNSFKKFTNEKYNEVLVSDKYDMMIKNEDGIFEGVLLSNGANDQLYLSLRIAFVNLIFEHKNIPVFLDDAFVQYDDKRTGVALELLSKEEYSQVFIFTCQNRERKILDEKKLHFNYISLNY